MVISNTTLVKIVIFVLKTYEICVNLSLNPHLNLFVMTVSSTPVKTATIALKTYESVHLHVEIENTILERLVTTVLKIYESVLPLVVMVILKNLNNVTMVSSIDLIDFVLLPVTILILIRSVVMAS